MLHGYILPVRIYLFKGGCSTILFYCLQCVVRENVLYVSDWLRGS